MNEEEIKLVVSMQLKEINNQLKQLKSQVGKAFQNIGNSREVNSATDNMERSFRDLNNSTSENMRQMYRQVRRYLGDMEHDIDKYTDLIRYEIEQMFNGLNGGNKKINFGGLTRALQDAIRNANLGDSVNNAFNSSNFNSANLLRGLSGLGSLFQILALADVINAMKTINNEVKDSAGKLQLSNKEIGRLAAGSSDVVDRFGNIYDSTTALNKNIVTLQKVLAMLLHQFGQMTVLLERIASIQMGTGLMNYGKYVSSAISQLERLKTVWDGTGDAPDLANFDSVLKSIEDYKSALSEVMTVGDKEAFNGLETASGKLKDSLEVLVRQMIIAQNTIHNLKSMADQGVLSGIDTGSLEKVSSDLGKMLDNIKSELSDVVTEGLPFDTGIANDISMILEQLGQFEPEINSTTSSLDDLIEKLRQGQNWQPEKPDFSPVIESFQEIDDRWETLAKLINGESITPRVDTSEAEDGLLHLKDLFNVFGGKEMFRQIDMDMPREVFDRMSAEAQEVKTIIDQMYAQFNEGVDFSSLNGVREQMDRIKLALEAAANARQHLNELDEQGLGTSEEAVEWTARLTNAQETLLNAIRQVDHEFGQYRLVDWTMFTRDAGQAVRNAATEIKRRLTEAMQNFGNSAGTILYRIGAYFTIPPERMDQIIAQLREKFSSFWDSVKSKGREALDAIAQSDIAQKLTQTFGPAFEKIAEFGKAAAEKIKAAFDGIANSRFGAFINNNLSLAVRGVKAVGNKLKEGFGKAIDKTKTLFTKFKDHVKTTMDKVKDHFKKSADKIKESSDGIGNSIKGLISKFVGLYAIISGLKALWNFGKEAMMLEGQLQNLYITLGAFYDEQGNKVLRGDIFQEWARSTAKAFAISEKAAIEYGNTFSMLLSQTIPKENLLTATTDLLQQASLIAMKTGRSVDDVMNRIRSGLLGGTEAIEDLGVYVRENTLKGLLKDTGFQEMYGEEIARNLGKSLDELHKNYANLDDDAKNTIRYYGVMYQSIRRFGQASEDSFKTTTGVLLKFQAEVENTKLALGNMVKPILTVVLPLLTTVLQWIQVIADKIAALFTSIAELLGYEVTDFGASVDIDYNSNIKDGAEEDAEALKKVDTQLAGIDEITKITRETEGSSTGIDLGDIELTNEGLLDLDKTKNKLKLPEWLQRIIDHFGVIRERLQPIIDDFKKIWEWIKKAWEELGGWDTVLNKIADGIIWILDRLTDLTLLLWNAIKYAWELAKVFSEGFFHGLTGLDINDFPDFKSWWNEVCDNMKAKWERTVNAIKGIWEGLVSIFTTEYTIFHFDDSGKVKLIETWKLLDDIDKFCKQLAHTIGYTLGYAFDLLSEVAISALEAINNYLKERGAQISYELHNIFTIGTDVLQQFEGMLENVRGTLEHFANTLGNTIGNTLMAIGESAIAFVEFCFGTIKTYLDQNGDYITQKINSIFTIYDETLQKLNEAVNWIRDLLVHLFENEDLQQIGASLLAIFSDAFLNIRELFAKFNQDVITLLVQPFLDNKDAFFQAVDNFLAPVAQLVESIKELFRSFWESIQTNYDKYVAPTFERLTEVLSNFVGFFLEMYNEHIAPVLQAWADKFDWLFEKLKPFFDNICQFIGNVIELLGNLMKVLEPILEFVAGVLIPTIMPLIRGLGELVADVIGIIVDCLNGLLEILNGVLEFLNGVFTLDWKRCWDGVVEVFKGCWDIIWGILSGLATGLKDAFSAIIDSILGIFRGLIDSVKRIFGIHSPSTVFRDMGKNLIQGLWNGISDVKQWIIDKIKGFSNDIINKVKSFFGIHSPSKVFAWIGQMLMRGLGIGIDKNGMVTSAIDKVMNDTYDTVASYLRDINTMFNDMLNLQGNVRVAYATSGMILPFNPDDGIKLAKGGIATSKVNATIGEAGREAVLPLENNTEWMDDLSVKVSENITSTIGDGDAVFQIGENEFYRIAKRSLLNGEKASGKKIFSNTRVK